MEPDIGKQSVTIMPESEGHILCIRNSGLVTADDYARYMANRLPGLVQEYGAFDMLMLYDDDYIGYTPEAADLSIRTMMDYGRFVRKMAYVNPPETRIMLHKMLPGVITGEIRFFNMNELPSALLWVES